MFSFFRRRKLVEALEQHVSPDVARRLVEPPPAVAPACREWCVEIAYVAIPAPDSAVYAERAGLVADIAHECQGTVYKLMPILVITFEINSTAHTRFISTVRTKLPEASIVHGNIVASIGMIGSGTRFDFGPWWPGSLDAVRLLASLSPVKSGNFRARERNSRLLHLRWRDDFSRA